MFSNVPIFGLIVLFIGTVVAEAPYIVYWIATFFITFFIGMMFRVSGLKKIGIWTGLFLVLNIPPLVVPVYSYYQFASLCKVEGYYKIYDTVELGPEHWDEEGRPKYLSKLGIDFVEYETGEDRYVGINESISYNKVVNLYTKKLVSSKSNKVLAVYSNASWVPAKFPDYSKMYKNLDRSTCGRLREGGDWPSFESVISNVFYKKDIENEQ